MRTYTDIAVQRAAVHVVAPKRGVLRQSSAEIELEDAVRGFLVGHVANGLADRQALAASFKIVGPQRTEGICRSIITSGQRFVGRSATLARLLYDASTSATGSDSRVSDGALLVCRCTARDGDEEVAFAALLKLDPNDAFRAEEDTDAKGRPVVRLVAQHDILPTPRERLQKAAFVRDRGHDYDALAVDHQRRGAVVSAFFLDAFLGLEHVLDDKQRTEQLYRTLKRTFDEVRSDLSPAQHDRLDQYLDGAVVGGRVSVDAIVDGLPTTEAVRERFEQALAEALPDREFETDERTAQHLVRRRRFVGDNGLTVTVRGDLYRDMVSVEPPADGDGRYTITIRTRLWSER